MKKLLLLPLLLLAWPAWAQPAGGVPTTISSTPIAISSATTTQLVSLTAGKVIYVTAVDVISSGTGNIQFVYGTGTNCGTGQTTVTGNYPLTAQVGFTKGTGYGALWVIPSGNALCAVTDASVTYAGSLSYAKF